jgi:hypothetical protein
LNPLALAGGAAALLLGVVLVIAWAMNSDQRKQVKGPGVPPQPPIQPEKVRTPDAQPGPKKPPPPGLPSLRAVALPIPQWEAVSQSVEPLGAFALSLRGEDLTPDADLGATYRASLANDAEHAVGDVTATLWLLGLDGKAYARRRLSLGVLGAGKAAKIEASLSRQDLVPLASLTWTFSASGPLRSPDTQKLTPGESPDGRGLEVQLSHTGAKPWKFIALTLAGFDAQGREVGRWKAQHTGRVSPGQAWKGWFALPAEAQAARWEAHIGGESGD